MKEKTFGYPEIASGLSDQFYHGNDNTLAKKILNSKGGLSIEGENITPVDLFYIPEKLSSSEKLDIIANNLKIKREDLAKELPEISKCWREAKQFLTEYLLPEGSHLRTLPKEIQSIETFKNLEELEKVFSRTTKIKKGKSLGYAPLYCALAILTITAKEYQTEEFDGLKNESSYLVNQLFKEDSDKLFRFHQIDKSLTKEWNKIVIIPYDNESPIPAKLSFRGKKKESILMKLASKPEIFAKEMIQDGIGLRFEVENPEKAKKLLIFLANFFQINFSTKQLFFENTRLIDKNDSEFFAKLRENEITFLENKNSSTHKNFASAKLRGKIEVPQNGEEGNMKLPRNFEIQVVVTDNKNETGLIQNPIYKRIQKLSLFTRLFGSFSEEFLDAMCREASAATGLSERKIKEHIIQRSLVRIPSSTSKITRYISFDQFLRWEKAGLIPPGFIINERDRKKMEKS